MDIGIIESSSWFNFICKVFGAVGAVLIPCVSIWLSGKRPHSHLITGKYYFSNTRKSGVKIHITLANTSNWWNACFIPANGIYIKTETDSEYLTLNADKTEYTIAHGTIRHLHFRTPATAQAFKFWKTNPQNRVFAFMAGGHRVELQHDIQKERILTKKD